MPLLLAPRCLLMLGTGRAAQTSCCCCIVPRLVIAGRLRRTACLLFVVYSPWRLRARNFESSQSTELVLFLPRTRRRMHTRCALHTLLTWLLFNVTVAPSFALAQRRNGKRLLPKSTESDCLSLVIRPSSSSQVPAPKTHPPATCTACSGAAASIASLLALDLCLHSPPPPSTLSALCKHSFIPATTNPTSAALHLRHI